MSRLIYGVVELKVIRTVRCDREAVYDADRTHYLYHRWTLEVTAVWNPTRTSYDAGPTEVVGIRSAVTDFNIRQYLLQERRQLQFIIGVDTILYAPQVGLVCDANNGPKPLHCTITQIAGVKTFLVRYAIEVCINECPSGIAHPLISSRWTERHTVDDTYFTLRIVEGRAKFRTDLLIFLGLNSDDFRNYLGHGIPDRFKRQSIDVVTSSDGTELSYTIVDRQQYLSLGADSAVKKVEGFLCVSTQSAGGRDSPAAYYLANIKVQAWGGPDTDKRDLLTFCARIATSRIDFAQPDVIVTHGSATESLFEPFVELDTTVRLTALDQVKTPGQNNQVIPWSDQVGRVRDFCKVDIPPEVTHSTLYSPPPHPDDATRGAWLGKLTAAALKGPCEVPPQSNDIINTPPPGTLRRQQGPEITIQTTDDLPEHTLEFRISTDPGKIYTDYKIDTNIHTDMHKRHVSVVWRESSQRTDSAVVLLSPPKTLKTVFWTAERINGPPQYPTTETLDPNEELLDEQINPSAPVLMPDGRSYVYRVSGVYVYANINPLKVGLTNYGTSVLPWYNRSYAQSAIPASLAEPGIIGV